MVNLKVRCIGIGNPHMVPNTKEISGPNIQRYEDWYKHAVTSHLKALLHRQHDDVVPEKMQQEEALTRSPCGVDDGTFEAVVNPV